MNMLNQLKSETERQKMIAINEKVKVGMRLPEFELILAQYTQGNTQVSKWSPETWLELFRLSGSPEYSNKGAQGAWLGKDYLNFLQWMMHTGPVYYEYMINEEALSVLESVMLERGTKAAIAESRKPVRL